MNFPHGKLFHNSHFNYNPKRKKIDWKIFMKHIFLIINSMVCLIGVKEIIHSLV